MNNENKYDFYFQRYAGNNKLDWMLLKAQVKAESAFDSNAVSEAGAMGLAQFMPPTWKEFGEGDPFDPEESIKAQAKYMRWLFDFMIKLLRNKKYLIEWSLAAYNWGIGNVRNLALDTNGNFEKAFGQLPGETQKYVKKVLKFYAEYNMTFFTTTKPKPITLNLEETKMETTKKLQPVKLPENPGVSFGINETTDVLNFGISLANALIKSLEDGKIQLTELASFVSPLTKIPSALSGISLVPAELGDLTDEEMTTLKSVVQDQLEVDDERAIEIIEKSIDAIYAIYNLVKAIGK